MLKRSRVICVFIVIMLVCSAVFCGCESSRPTSGAIGTEIVHTENAPTSVPEATDSAEATEEPAATDEPAPAEATQTFEAVPFDEDHLYDMNGDGVKDVIHISTEVPDEYDFDYVVTVKGGDGSETDIDCRDIIERCYEGYAIIVDDANDELLPALLVCVWHDSDDPTVFAYRVDTATGGFKSFTCYSCFADPDMGTPVHNGLLTLGVRTELMGTCTVYGDYTVGEKEFVLVSDDYQYAANIRSIAVINDMPAAIVDGDSTYEITVGPGSTVMPLSTDMQTYVYVLLSSGEYAYVYFEDAEYPFNINGRPQDYYLDVLYCD